MNRTAIWISFLLALLTVTTVMIVGESDSTNAKTSEGPDLAEVSSPGPVSERPQVVAGEDLDEDPRESHGEGAADRMSAPDRPHEAWQQRLDAYRDAKAAIGEGSDEELDALRAIYFSEAEIPRVRALEQAGAI